MRAAQSPIVAGGRPPQTGFCSSANSAAGTTDCGRDRGGLRARPGARGAAPGRSGAAREAALRRRPRGRCRAGPARGLQGSLLQGPRRSREETSPPPNSAESFTRRGFFLKPLNSLESWRTELLPRAECANQLRRTQSPVCQRKILWLTLFPSNSPFLTRTKFKIELLFIKLKKKRKDSMRARSLPFHFITLSPSSSGFNPLTGGLEGAGDRKGGSKVTGKVFKGTKRL